MTYYQKRTYQPRGTRVQFPAPVAEKARPTRTPSPLQQAILDATIHGTGNLLVTARAGSGKTSTLEMLAWAIMDAATAAQRTVTAVFLAFNKSTQTELDARLPFAASTFHALGFRAIGPVLSALNNGRRSQVDANKCGRIFDEMYGREAAGSRAAVLKLVSLMKNSALMPEAPECELSQIVGHFDIEWQDDKVTERDIIDMARSVLSANNAETSVVDFDDMLYLVVVLDVKLQPFDYIMIDESQDTNEIQRVLLRRMMTPRTRLIAVGDAAQAIYGFRGASHDAMDLIREEFDCKEMPLSISYRCPASVIRLAQQYVPDIRARDNAPEGSVLYPTTWKLTDFIPTDLLVCRNTAPLVQVAYRMISARIPCKIMGREIGKGLTVLIRKLLGKRGALDDLPEKLAEYQDREVRIAMARKQETKAQAIADKCESILALLDSMTETDRARGVDGLCAIIESLFDDKASGMTTLATVHKAKGMEAPRVFIVDAHLMPSKYAKQEWQLTQERNLQYVAITRALETLVYVQTEYIGV